jgi:acetylornithine deacetylase
MPSHVDPGSLVRDHADHLVRILQDLVRSAERGHAAVQDLVERRLAGAGAEVRRIAYRPRDVAVAFEVGAPTELEGDAEYVVGTFGEGDDGLVWFAHSDSEPVDASSWTRAPFDGAVADGRLYGWGVGDDLVGVALLIALAELHAAAPLLGGGRTVLASVPSKRRAQAIIHALDQGYVGAGSVYLHPAESGSGLREIKAIASGLLRFRVRLQGRPPATSEPGHTVFLHTGIDPVALAARWIGRLHAFGEARAERVHYAPVHDAIGRSTNVHVTRIEAGRPDRPSQVPARVDLFGSLTFPPTEDLVAVQAALAAELHAFAATDPWLAEHPPELTWLVGIGGAATSLDDRLYRFTHEAITAVTGIEPHVNPLHAGSDIRNPILHKGIPTVGIGPLVGDLTVSGGHDEWVDVADYLRAVEVVCRVAQRWGTT